MHQLWKPKVRVLSTRSYIRSSTNPVSCLLPNLTWIQIVHCDRCRRLPTFSRLPNLKHLELEGLDALEYIEEGEERSGGTSTANISEAAASSSGPPLPYFPSLEKLSLWRLAELKGWSRIHLNIGPNSFPRLQELQIIDLDHLEALPAWIGHLTQLRLLSIYGCSKLSEFPESIGSLTASTQIIVLRCPELERRYKKPNGEASPLVQKVPHVYFSERVMPPTPFNTSSSVVS